ncbi:MAG TPA: hypothetical protein VJ397_01520 [Thermoplasmata archaeon]|nr:hypothetical protein [Thermoplasmata archaeon]
MHAHPVPGGETTTARDRVTWRRWLGRRAGRREIGEGVMAPAGLAVFPDDLLPGVPGRR